MASTEIGEVKFSKVYVDIDWDSSIYISVQGSNGRTSAELTHKEAKKLIKALKRLTKGGK